MTKLDVERAELRAFSADVRADAARSLDLLRDIESTLAWLHRLTGTLRVNAAFAESFATSLQHEQCVIDPGDHIQDSLETAQTAVESLHGLLIEKREHGRNDARLNDEDGIEAAYTEAIAQAADLHNALNMLRWNIGEHDIDVGPKQISKAYDADDIDRMFDDLLDS